MEPRIFRWVSELGLEEAGFILQPELISQLNQFSTQETAATSLDDHEDIQQSLSSESSTLCSFIFSVGNMERAQRVNNFKDEPGLFFGPDAPLLLSFAQHQPQSDSIINEDYHAKDHGSKRKRLGSETESKKTTISMKQPPHVHDHIIAERRRREKLSQRFIALAAIIPGLKKMDKASVLGDAIKHIKDLEERVKILDDKLVKKTVEIVTMNMKPHDDSNDCQSSISSLENNSINVSSFDDQKLHTHDMQVKISEKAVLVKMHCENHKGVLIMVISKIEELHLKITNISALPFLGSTFIDITVAAQIDEEGCSITVTDVVKKLNSGLSKCN